MMAMTRRNKVGTALVLLAIVLFVYPALFPVQPQLIHNTRTLGWGDAEELRTSGFEVIVYENLSDRGQVLYTRTIENDGQLYVPHGQGAPEFEYPTRTEGRRASRSGNESLPGLYAIDRPKSDPYLPHSQTCASPQSTSEETREDPDQARCYDLMVTLKQQPPLGSPPQLLRLLASLIAVISLGIGGYLLSSK